MGNSELSEATSNESEPIKTRVKLRYIVFWVIVFMAYVPSIRDFVGAKVADASLAKPPAFEGHLGELVDEFRSNPDAVRDEFSGKAVLIDGALIAENLTMHKPFILLGIVPNDDCWVKCHFDYAEYDVERPNIWKGKEIRLLGVLKFEDDEISLRYSRFVLE